MADAGRAPAGASATRSSWTAPDRGRCSCSRPRRCAASTRCPRRRPARASPTGRCYRKLPDELFDGRRTIMHELFGRDDVRPTSAQLDAAIDVTFDGARRCRRRRRVRLHPPARPPHRASPAGPARAGARRPLRRARGRARRARRLGRLRAPRGDGRGRGRRQGREPPPWPRRGARAETVARARALASAERPDDCSPRIMDALGRRTPEPARTHRHRPRRRSSCTSGRCRTCSRPRVDDRRQLALHPDVLARVARRRSRPARTVRARSRPGSGQRSIMLRAVVRPATVRDEHPVRSRPAPQIATLLPLTNCRDAGPRGLRPRRWLRRRLRDEPISPHASS